MNDAEKKKFNRAQKVLEIAERMAAKHPDWQVRSRIEEMRIHPGYAGHPEDGAVVTGNWNNITEYVRDKNEHTLISDLPERLGIIFEKLGFETEWNDEWAECDDCYNIVRTEPDSWFWTPQYVEDQGEVICRHCFEEDPSTVLYNYGWKHKELRLGFDFDPGQHGFEKYKQFEFAKLDGPSLVVLLDKTSAELHERRIRCFFIHITGNRNEETYTFWVDSDEYEDDTVSEEDADSVVE